MEPSDLERAVGERSWEWLADLPRRLNVVIEVIDDRHGPMFPAGSTPGAAAADSAGEARQSTVITACCSPGDSGFGGQYRAGFASTT